MPTLGANVLTLADWAKRLDPNGKIDSIAELLNQSNPILDDMLWKEGNLPTGHRVTVRTGLPSSFWRVLNNGIPPSKSTTAQIDEAIGMLETYSVVDKDEAELNGQVNDFRLSEAASFVESMSQNMAATLFYGDTTVNPERFLGLHARFNTISGAPNGQNILSAGGSGSDNTSVWLVGWGPQSVWGTFPKGSKAGIIHEDLGLETVTVTTGISGSLMRAYRDHWQWKCGLVVKDWRYVARLANIDVSDLKGSTGTQNAQQLISQMSQMLDLFPGFGGIKPVFYMNRSVFSMLRVQALNKSTNALAIEPAATQFGHPANPAGMSFFGIPIKRCDQILNNEAVIS